MVGNNSAAGDATFSQLHENFIELVAKLSKAVES